MLLPIILIPLAISAVKALLRYREQVDTILSLNAATEGLPFALPPIPTNDAPHLQEMLTFFKSDQGQLILELRALVDDFAAVLTDPTSVSPTISGPRARLFRLYYEAAGVHPEFLGPVDLHAQKAIQELTNPEMRLAYYTVESQRLSRNTALVRVVLVTTDTLLEFAGENAKLFINHPQTRSLVQDLIEEFAGKRDFDEEGIDAIFKSLLGSTLLALANNPGNLANKPALKALFAALGDVRDSLGNDFVAKLISVDSFEHLITAYATQLAKDPAFLTKTDLAQKVLAAMLIKIGKNFRQIVDDPRALLGVLEVGLGAAATNVTGILQRELEGQPLLAAVLAGVLKQVVTLGQSNQLFASIANGQIIPDIYKTTLQAIAATPINFAHQGDVEKFVSNLIAGLANALSHQELSKFFPPDTLRLLASDSLTVLGADPQFIVAHNQFATKLLAAVFKASAAAVSEGLSREDLIGIAMAAIKAASENIALLNLNEQLAAAVTAFGDAIAASNLTQLVNAEGRKAMLLGVLQAIAANPTMWGRLQSTNLIQPLVQAIFQGLATDPTHLLSGPILVDAVSHLLLAAARRGQQFVAQTVQPEALKQLLTLALIRANQEVGRAIDGKNLPAYLARVLSAYLTAPFTLTDALAANFKQLIDNTLVYLDITDQS